jgi:hypothetical protein
MLGCEKEGRWQSESERKRRGYLTDDVGKWYYHISNDGMQGKYTQRFCVYSKPKERAKGRKRPKRR